MTEWIWIKFDEQDEWQPAELRDGRYYPALESGWFDAEELWEVGPAVASPTAAADLRAALDRETAAIARAEAADAEVERLRAENERLREAHRENNRLLGLVAHDLTGRVEGGKVAAIYTAINNALAALAEGGGDE